jgi:hypothetical protein
VRVMSLSTQALQEQLAKYDALVSNVRMSDYGYWVVTYSVAPGLSLSMMVCDTTLDKSSAPSSLTGALSAMTGQTVRPP